MPIKRFNIGIPTISSPAEGIFYQNTEILSLYQKKCIERFGKTIQLEQQAYLDQHPEVNILYNIV